MWRWPGAAWRPFQKLSINADFEDGSSGSTYFRTSLYNYQKARVRGTLSDLAVAQRLGQCERTE